jgi:hypothetical protein
MSRMPRDSGSSISETRRCCTHQASSFSITSALTNSSMSSWTTTAFLPSGSGKLTYMNGSYVVEV